MFEKSVFVCYQRADSRDLAGRLRDALARQLDDVFFDVESIPGGVTYSDYITSRIKRVDVVLVLIGERWDAARLHDLNDDVRAELMQARAFGKHVIPVLLGRADVPKREVLPADLTWLIDINAVPIRAENGFLDDANKLARSLKGSASRRGLVAAGVVGLVAVGAAVGLLVSKGGGNGTAAGTTGQQVEVPPVVRLDSDDAESRLKTVGLRTVFQAVLDDSLLYRVTAASRDAGTLAKVGDTINLKVTLDPTSAAFVANPVTQVRLASCAGGQFTIDEQQWRGINVKSAHLTVKKSNGNSELDLTVSKGTDRGSFSGRIGKQTVPCSNTASTTVTYTLTAKGPPPVEGGAPPTVTADTRFTIGPALATK